MGKIADPQPVLLADRLRWRAANARRAGNHALASECDRDADTLAQMQQAVTDLRQIVAERDETIRRLNSVIRRLGGGQQ